MTWVRFPAMEEICASPPLPGRYVYPVSPSNGYQRYRGQQVKLPDHSSWSRAEVRNTSFASTPTIRLNDLLLMHKSNFDFTYIYFSDLLPQAPCLTGMDWRSVYYISNLWKRRFVTQLYRNNETPCLLSHLMNIYPCWTIFYYLPSWYRRVIALCIKRLPNNEKLAD